MLKNLEQVNQGVFVSEEQTEIREYRALYEDDVRASECSTGRKLEHGAVQGAADRRAGERCATRAQEGVIFWRSEKMKMVKWRFTDFPCTRWKEIRNKSNSRK